MQVKEGQWYYIIDWMKRESSPSQSLDTSQVSASGEGVGPMSRVELTGWTWAIVFRCGLPMSSML